MLSKTLVLASLMLSLPTNAAIVDMGNITRDTDTSIEWLDVTETLNQSVNGVKSQMSIGGALEGWRYATYLEFETLLVNFGYLPQTNSECSSGQAYCDYGMETDSELIEYIISTLGDTEQAAYGPIFRGDQEYLSGALAGYFDSDNVNLGSPDFAQIYDIETRYIESGLPATDYGDFVDSLKSSSHATFNSKASNAGHFLVRPSVVPPPPRSLALRVIIARLGGERTQ